MKKRNIDETKNEIFKQIQRFDSMLFNRRVKVDDELRALAHDVVDMVDNILKEDIDDFDLWVFVKYREGKMRSKYSRIRKLEPKTLITAIDEGFVLPDNATMVSIDIRPVLKKGYNINVSTQSIYSVEFGLNNGEELTIPQLKRRYNLGPDDKLLSVKDMQENSQILKFYKNKKKRAKRDVLDL